MTIVHICATNKMIAKLEVEQCSPPPGPRAGDHIPGIDDQQGRQEMQYPFKLSMAPVMTEPCPPDREPVVTCTRPQIRRASRKPRTWRARRRTEEVNRITDPFHPIGLLVHIGGGEG